MAREKKGTIVNMSDHMEKEIHKPEFSSHTDLDVHGDFPEKVPMAEQIKKYRKAAKIPQLALAEKLGVTRNTVINWEAGKYRPDADLFPPLCKILGITLNDLFGIKSGPADTLSQHERELIFHYRLISPLSQRIVDRMLVSIFDEEAQEKDRILIDNTNIIAKVPTVAAAGNGFSFSDWPVEDFCFVFKNSRNDRADAIINVKGDSMLPVYKDGDEVYVEKTDRAEIGEDVICVSTEGLHIKRLGNDGPYSLNPDYPFTLTEESDHVEIIGRVLGIVDASSDFPNASESNALRELKKDEITEFKEEYHLS